MGATLEDRMNGEPGSESVASRAPRSAALLVSPAVGIGSDGLVVGGGNNEGVGVRAFFGGVFPVLGGRPGEVPDLGSEGRVLKAVSAGDCGAAVGMAVSDQKQGVDKLAAVVGLKGTGGESVLEKGARAAVWRFVGKEGSRLSARSFGEVVLPCLKDGGCFAAVVDRAGGGGKEVLLAERGAEVEAQLVFRDTSGLRVEEARTMVSSRDGKVDFEEGGRVLALDLRSPKGFSPSSIKDAVLVISPRRPAEVELRRETIKRTLNAVAAIGNGQAGINALASILSESIHEPVIVLPLGNGGQGEGEPEWRFKDNNRSPVEFGRVAEPVGGAERREQGPFYQVAAERRSDPEHPEFCADEVLAMKYADGEGAIVLAADGVGSGGSFSGAAAEYVRVGIEEAVRGLSVLPTKEQAVSILNKALKGAIGMIEEYIESLSINGEMAKKLGKTVDEIRDQIGTTLSVAMVCRGEDGRGRELLTYNIGDSRIVVYTPDGGIKILTREVAELAMAVENAAEGGGERITNEEIARRVRGIEERDRRAKNRLVTCVGAGVLDAERNFSWNCKPQIQSYRIAERGRTPAEGEVPANGVIMAMSDGIPDSCGVAFASGERPVGGKPGLIDLFNQAYRKSRGDLAVFVSNLTLETWNRMHARKGKADDVSAAAMKLR